MRLAAALGVLAMSASSHADVVSHVDVSYFAVEGSNLPEIYRSTLARGPRVNGAQALASIGTRATQDGDLEQQGGSCRVTDYVISLEFVIQRPRIASEQVLSPDDRALWQQMNEFIVAHENQHKEVWAACAGGLDASMAALRAPTCNELGDKAEALWQDMLASCDKTQRAFDAAQSRVLMQQPFMRRALNDAH